jgi:hypothetical protein
MRANRVLSSLLRPRLINPRPVVVRPIHTATHLRKPLLPIHRTVQSATRTTRTPTRLLTSSAMTAATASAIHLTPDTPGSTHADVSHITDTSSAKASSLLQLNHDQNHIFFNPEGFHNHIAHQLLAMFALGASPEELQRAYDDNSGYQRPLGKVNEANVKAFVDEEDGDSSNGTGAQVKGQVQGRWKECLGKQKHFHDFEEYFQRRIDEKGWREVVKEALFAGTERSEDLLIRMFGGMCSCSAFLTALI